MESSEFKTFLKSKGYSFSEENGIIIVNNQGGVYLSSLTTLPENIQFNNQGYVDLSSLTVYDEVDAGKGKRKLYVVNSKDGLKLSLGCFSGNQTECIEAISKKYGESAAGSLYKEKVNNAFSKAKSRYN